jgi:hypothetical protein
LPTIIHPCGAKLTFPDGMEGRKGRCPTCGQAVVVPGTPGKSSGSMPALSKSGPTPAIPPAKASPFRASDRHPAVGSAAKGRSPHWRGDTTVAIEPPSNWADWETYLAGKGEAPKASVIPANIMLKDDADAKWSAGMQKAPPSKYHCPGCKTRLEVKQLVCTGCGLDLRTGRSVDGKTKVTPEGDAYLAKIPWVAEARAEEEGEDEEDGEDDGKGPRLPKPRKPRRL